MFWQFRFRMLNESVPGFRDWPIVFSSLLGDSLFARAFQRGQLFPPAGNDADDAAAPAQASAFVDRLIQSIGRPGPVANADPGPVAAIGDLGTLRPASGIAFMAGSPGGPADQLPPGMIFGSGGRFQVQFGEGLIDPMVIDTLNMVILPGHATDPQFGGGDNDILVLAGPFAASTLPSGLPGLETLLLQGGTSFDLTSLDDRVDRGARLLVDARDLGTDDSVSFDASGESDGFFLFLGGEGDDTFLGGAGNDRIDGGGGADTLRGGGGADTFVYGFAGDSSGANYDTLLGFNAAEDRIDLPVTVSGFDAAVLSGTLSTASFDGDLAAALGSLGAGRALLYSPDAGDLAGTLFLVVDGNGDAGYQAGEDFVFALPGGSITDLGASAAIFV
jgi:Ca2+-binding RTX toxin-like protein